ncbi:FadR/GntR family transcriptional regulator [Taklimakanibacter deserti]|jgi:GntR family transcriptional regulator, galactonate operon transcriptional repressor|uniref:FadR/GntR family transcriptional regulator n=1 Tax=Taklimakanibacter deserti TaxID=2267839 RepID=UPI000E649384
MARHPRLALGRAQKRNLFAHVVEELGTRVIRGDLKPDDPFPIEADLGREFGASRSVIREAVKSLAARGLIESKTRTGIRVLPPTHWNLLDPEVLSWRYSVMPPAQFYSELFEIRLMIEPQAAALAASRATQADIAEMSEAFGEMSKTRETGTAAVEADLRFHRAILSAGKNALLHQMGNLIAVGLYISHQASSESFVVFLPQHGQVLTAIRARDPQAARRAMEKLLNETRDFVTSHMKSKKRAR